MSGEIKDVKMTTVLSVIFSGWHPHHLGQTGHLHQGVVLPQQSGLQRSSFSSPLVRRDHNLGPGHGQRQLETKFKNVQAVLLQDLGLGYYYCDITSDFNYLFLGENKYFDFTHVVTSDIPCIVGAPHILSRCL